MQSDGEAESEVGFMGRKMTFFHLCICLDSCYGYDLAVLFFGSLPQ